MRHIAYMSSFPNLHQLHFHCLFFLTRCFIYNRYENSCTQNFFQIAQSLKRMIFLSLSTYITLFFITRPCQSNEISIKLCFKRYSLNYEKHPKAILPFKTINEKWKNLHDLLFILHFLWVDFFQLHKSFHVCCLRTCRLKSLLIIWNSSIHYFLYSQKDILVIKSFKCLFFFWRFCLFSNWK